MRVLVLILLSCAVLAVMSPKAAAQSPATQSPAARTPAAADAATAFAERSALLAASERCTLLAEGEMQALRAGAAQARGALLRAGWTTARIEALRTRAIVSVEARACGDAALTQSAGAARAGFAAWTRLSAMQFPGAAAPWRASRAPDAEGWVLRQDGRAGTILGVRLDPEDGYVVAFSAPLTANSPEPAFAVLSFRDAGRAPASLAEVPGRAGTGLAAVAASPGMARQVFALGRRINVTEEGVRVAVLTFPAEAFAGVEALDPREAIEVRLGRTVGETAARVYFEVGDLAAAQAFLAAVPAS